MEINALLATNSITVGVCRAIACRDKRYPLRLWQEAIAFYSLL